MSPVRIQIFISAFIRVSMVSGTLSWSLSSIAVAPSSCRFYSRIFFKKRQWEAITGEKNMSLQHHVSEKHASQECVTHSAMFPFISCCLSRRKPQQAFRKKGVYVCVCVCIHRRHLSYTAKAIQYSVFCFFFLPLQESWWFFGASCRLISGQNRVKYLTRPRGRGETWASSRGKAEGGFWNGDFSSSGPVCSSAGPSSEKPHSTQSCACGGTTPLDLMSLICLFDVDCSIVPVVLLKRDPLWITTDEPLGSGFQPWSQEGPGYWPHIHRLPVQS